MTLTFMTTKASSSDAGREPSMRYFSAPTFASRKCLVVGRQHE
jgi:hypothetical protein